MVAGGALLRAGAANLRHVGSPQEERDRATARALFGALAQMRGTALKVAQVLFWEDDLVPSGAADELYRACYQAPPIGAARATVLIQREIGARSLAEFDPQAFAAASLGQVHYARDHEGVALVVKLRYPGVEQSIDADLRVLGGVARYLPNPPLFRALLDEIRQRLVEECDYEREASHTQWFADQLNVDGVEIPHLRPELCTSSVLTMTHVRGAHLREWLTTNPSQAARDACAQRMYDAYCKSLYALQRVHADPNPGNYLFRDDGTVGLIDFGCVKPVTPRFSELVAATTRCYLDRREEEAFGLMQELGFYQGAGPDQAHEMDVNLVRPFAQHLVLPMRDERFDFAANRGFAAECGRRFLQIVKHSGRAGMYPELLFVNRTQYGLYRIFELLGATVRLGNEWV